MDTDLPSSLRRDAHRRNAILIETMVHLPSATKPVELRKNARFGPAYASLASMAEESLREFLYLRPPDEVETWLKMLENKTGRFDAPLMAAVDKADTPESQMSLLDRPIHRARTWVVHEIARLLIRESSSLPRRALYNGRVAVLGIVGATEPQHAAEVAAAGQDLDAWNAEPALRALHENFPGNEPGQALMSWIMSGENKALTTLAKWCVRWLNTARLDATSPAGLSRTDRAAWFIREGDDVPEWFLPQWFLNRRVRECASLYATPIELDRRAQRRKHALELGRILAFAVLKDHLPKSLVAEITVDAWQAARRASGKTLPELTQSSICAAIEIGERGADPQRRPLNEVLGVAEEVVGEAIHKSLDPEPTDRGIPEAPSAGAESASAKAGQPVNQWHVENRTHFEEFRKRANYNLTRKCAARFASVYGERDGAWINLMACLTLVPGDTPPGLIRYFEGGPRLRAIQGLVEPERVTALLDAVKECVLPPSVQPVGAKEEIRLAGVNVSPSHYAFGEQLIVWESGDTAAAALDTPPGLRGFYLHGSGLSIGRVPSIDGIFSRDEWEEVIAQLRRAPGKYRDVSRLAAELGISNHVNPRCGSGICLVSPYWATLLSEEPRGKGRVGLVVRTWLGRDPGLELAVTPSGRSTTSYAASSESDFQAEIHDGFCDLRLIPDVDLSGGGVEVALDLDNRDFYTRELRLPPPAPAAPERNPEETAVPRKRKSAPGPSFRTGATVTATVAFFHIPPLKSADATTSFRAIQALHALLEEEVSVTKARVLSALTGAIVVIPDSLATFFHPRLARIGRCCTERGVPLRVGVAHGELEVLEDADELPNFIGTPLNVAARLAASKVNANVFYDLSYSEHATAYVAADDDVLNPSRGERVEVPGKEHDKPFICRSAPALAVIDSLDARKLPTLGAAPDTVNGVALAYDLPRFSSGDRATLSSRFRSVADVLKRVKAEGDLDRSPILSPGGDGGILVLPTDKKRGFRIADELIRALEVESDNKAGDRRVESRVGLHYGNVALYKNAEGVPRPTGRVCFVADSIAAGTAAGSGVVLSEAFRDVVTDGNHARFAQDYEELPAIVEGVAASVARFSRRKNGPSRSNRETPP